MRRCCVVAASLIAVLIATPAWADSFWDHNGSLMRLHAEGPKRVFTYEEPRSGVAAQGVERGTILFDGEFADKRSQYKGTAFIFSKRCGNKPYDVEGYLQDHPNLIIMSGSAPEFDRSTCKKDGAKEDKLSFKFLRSDEPPPKFPDAAEGTICGYVDHDVANYDYDDYSDCLEAQANKICQGRDEIEELHRCFNAAADWARKKSGLTGYATDSNLQPFVLCDEGECHFWGGGSSYTCLRLDANRVEECDGLDGERDERVCNKVKCPVRTCRMLCSKAEEDDEK